jgi:dipeptidyl aminopeptidase/acylaminoacyl peptidase
VNPPPARFEQFFAIRRFHMLGNVAFSPGGDQVSYTHDGSGQMNLWTSPVGGGWPVQLTTLEDESVRHHVWTPHGFVLAVDHHGSEQWQVNRLSPGGGWPRDLTGRTDVQYQISARALDDQGERLIFGGNQARPADQSLYLLHIGDDEIRPVLEDEGNWFAGPWHPDGRHVAVGEFIGNTDQHLHLLDLHSGEHRDLTPHEGDEVNAPVGFSRDGRSLLMVTDRGHENVWLGRLPLESGTTAETVWRGGWDVEHALLSQDRRTLAWTVNEGGYSRFFARDLETGLDLEVPDLPRGHCLHFAISGDGRRLAAVIGTGTRPYDVYVADLKSATVTRVTESALGGIPEADLVDPELVSYPTFDGGQVPAWLYRPRNVSGRIPVLLSIHGGPEAQERGTGASTLPFYQYLLSRGVGVLAPNIRGSTGYGKSYQKQIHRDWGGAELRDIEHAALYLRSLPWVDRDRLAVYGGSFGGFATLSAMTRLPDYWACGVDLVGPANLVTFVRAVPPFWRRSMKAWVGDPDEDAEMLMQRSPITYAEGLRAPLLVIQGAQDPRVVKSESDQMVERLRALGRTVEYRVFEDEGHGLTKRRNQLAAYRMIGDFLCRHLGVDASTS